MKEFKKVVTSFYQADVTDKFEIIPENTDVSNVRSKHQLPNKIVKFCLTCVPTRTHLTVIIGTCTPYINVAHKGRLCPRYFQK